MSNEELHDDKEQLTPAGEREIGALEAFWSFFSSMKTAIVLLLLLAAASIAGTIIEDKRGITIYGTTWFSIILLLVGINLAVCSINRFGIAWRRTFRPDVEASPERVEGMTRSEKIAWSGSPEDAAGKVVAALRAGSYRLIKQSTTETLSVYAAKGRASVWGPYMTHVSILLIFAGAIYGNMTGSEGYTTIQEGKRAAAYYPKGSEEKTPLGFEVALRSFKIKHDKNHNPIGYKSDLQVYDGGKQVAHKVVDVNHPLSYKGLSFYQTDYGLVGLIVKVAAADGHAVHVPYNIQTQDTKNGRAYVITDDPLKQFVLHGKKLTLFVHNLVPDYIGGERLNGTMLPLNPAVDVMLSDQFPERKGIEAWKRIGWMTVSKSAPYKEFTVTLEKVVSYTGLQVSRNPGLPIIYLGFTLMVLGVFLSFYVAHKIIRVSIAPAKSGATVTVGATTRAETDIFDKDFKRIHDALT
ncbi:MAG: cytochrome c biogenesis protein ResB [Armatimonadetes bacterium]|nr:cytochrome c biogenesis protein ResB [Armatimonadota bacterium]